LGCRRQTRFAEPSFGVSSACPEDQRKSAPLNDA
jgi:hypothetical protein